MKPLYLVRFAQSAFGKLGNTTIEAMIRSAGSEGLQDLDRTQVDHVSVAGLLAPMLNDQSLLGGLVAMDEAYTNKSIRGVANACDSGGLAVIDCAAQILAGLSHVGLALGVEKMHPLEGKLDSDKVGKALGTAAHMDDLFPPLTFPHAFAVIMDRYMRAYGYSEEEMAVVPTVFYDNVAHNPLGHQHGFVHAKGAVTVEKVLASHRLFQDPPLPLKLFECSQISDGWARILVCDDEGLTRLGVAKEEATQLLGFGQATDSLSIASRGDTLLRPVGAKKAFVSAMAMAGARPSDISLQEVHDCFGVMAPLSVEITGLADAGHGLRHFLDGQAGPGGSCPINTSGGLIAKGHPISATGIAMVGWIHDQLRGRAPSPLQVASPKLGTTLNIGGPICSTVVTVQAPVV